MIKPTVGRIVWYRPTPNDGLISESSLSPLAALIVAVWSDTCVNLTVFDSNGNPHGRTSVQLFQDDALRPEHVFCEWMPHQVGQAAKTEELQAELNAVRSAGEGI